MTKAASPSYFQSVLDWLHKGYPDGVPPTDYYPLLALLARSLDEDPIVEATWPFPKDGHPGSPVTEGQTRHAVRDVTAQEPNSNEINQVAARLALVGWPLASHC